MGNVLNSSANKIEFDGLAWMGELTGNINVIQQVKDVLLRITTARGALGRWLMRLRKQKRGECRRM